MNFDNEKLLKLYNNLVRARKFDELAVRLLAEGKFLAFYHSAQGGEAPGVGGATFLRKDDYLWTHIRGHGIPAMLSKGLAPRFYFAEHCGRATGICNGLGGFHRASPEFGMLGTATIGACFPITLGWGVAAQKKGQGQVVGCFFGDGTIQRGTWHEAANVAALWKLPIVYICENNGVAQYVSLKNSYPLDDLTNLATGYGMPAAVVDGQDVVAVAETVMAAVDRARAGQGPSLIECKTVRYLTHGMGNPDMIDGKPRSREEVDEWKKRDPVVIFRERLLAQGILSSKDVERIDEEVEIEIKETVSFIDDSPYPESSVLNDALYAE